RIVRDHDQRLEREGVAALRRHQADEAATARRDRDRAQRLVHLSARVGGKDVRHRLDAVAHRQRLEHLLVAEHQHGRHQANRLPIVRRSSSLSVRPSASRTGSRCSGFVGPTTTKLRRGSLSSHARARPPIDTSRSAAMRSSSSRASNTSSVMNFSYGSGRCVIREPAGNAWPRRYLPVSQPPASGPNAAYAMSWRALTSSTPSSCPRSSSEYAFWTHAGAPAAAARSSCAASKLLTP